MAYTNARPSYGALLALSSIGSSGTFTTLAGITQITPFKYTRETVDLSDMNSTDYFEDVIITGPIRTGGISFECNYISTDTNHNTDLKSYLTNGTRVGWKITFAGTSSNNIFYGDGAVSEYAFKDLTINGKVAFTIAMKTRGSVTGPVSSTT